jgi:hypothetical protein
MVEGQHEEAIACDDALHLIAEDAEGRKIGYVIIRGLLNPHHCYEIFRNNLITQYSRNGPFGPWSGTNDPRSVVLDLSTLEFEIK